MAAPLAWRSTVVENPCSLSTSWNFARPELGADQHGCRDVVRAQVLIERAEPLLRLDHDPAPALQIEVKRHVVGDRVPGADVDIEPVRLPVEDLGEVVVLEVLGVREVHGARLTPLPACGERPNSPTASG